MAGTKGTLRRLLTLLVVTLVFAGGAWAATGQYYLVGYQAPEGSITSAGQGKRVVYLRWDALEGELPADVVALRLERDGQVIMPDTPVGEVKSSAEIAALYEGPAQQRRLLETIKNLKELAVSQDRDFSTGAFADAIRERLLAPPGTEDALWAFLASRNDINIARARNRAYVDDPGLGQFSYELLAVDVEGATARLGYFEIDTTQPQDLLPPEYFMQVLQGQCDAPEMGKDHYTVSLNWESPGTGNVSDRLGAQIYISGYDLYRTKENLDPLATSAPARDIRVEAAGSGFDNRGNPTLAGLEKVNDVLLTVNGDGDTTTEWTQKLANVDVAGGLAPEWIETQDQLRLAGLAPGDKRGYYLVPRDFTGNYGPTVATVVVVPNFIRPPAPWELREFIDQTAEEDGIPETGSAISWDKVNFDNYLSVYAGTRRFCNLVDARTSGVLEFVGLDEDCETDARRSVRLDVSDYRVYRFASFEEARLFKDSDGDGFGDTRDKELNGPGAQCAFNPPAGSDNKLVATTGDGLTEVALPRTGRRTMRFYDDAPKNDPGGVYWYRVASVTPDGRLSLLSAPQRAISPDREMPARPNVSMWRPAQVPDGGCEVVVDDDRGAWGFREQLDGQQFVLSCPPYTGEFRATEFDVATGNRRNAARSHPPVRARTSC